MKLPRLLLLPAAFLLSANLTFSTAPQSSKKRNPAPRSAQSKSSKSKTAAKKGARSGRYRRPAGPPAQVVPSADRIQEIQQALVARGYDVPITGSWGPDTEQALKKFQSDQNLPARGKLDSLSLISLGLGPKREPARATPPQERD